MKKVLTLITIGLLSTGLYANEKMDHSTNMKNNSQRGMLHGQNKPYHHMDTINGYKVMLSSKGPLKKSMNNLTVVIMKGKIPIKDSDINIEFTSSDKIFNVTPLLKGNSYKTDVKFDMAGHWMYKLNFKINDNSHVMKGTMNIR